MKTRRVSSQLTVRDTDPLVREHRVNDIHILPGVAMLDPVYRTLGAAGWAPEDIVLRDVLFHEPVVTHAGMDRRLSVSLALHADGGEVSVSSVPCRDEQVLSDERTLHLSGVLARADVQAPLPPLESDAAAAAAVDMDTAYAVARHIGIHHDPFMKCLGTVTPLAQGRCRASIALGDAAAARSDDFLLHPVFLDCATIVALAGLGDRRAEASLFIPFSIGEFRAVSLRGHRHVQVEVGASELGRSDQEILRYTTALFDLDGQPLARIERFGVKRVRSLDGIQRLLHSGNSARLHAVAAPAAATAPAKPELVAAGAAPVDDALGLIGELVAAGAGRTWQASDATQSFFDLGLDSLALLDMAEALETRLAVRLYPTLLFECPSPAQLAAYLNTTFEKEVTAALSATPPAVASACAVADEPAGSSAGVMATRPVGPVTPASPPATPPIATPAAAPAARDAREPVIRVPRWVPVPDAAPSAPAGAVALLGSPGAGALQTQLAARWGEAVRLVSTQADGAQPADALRAALCEGQRFDSVVLLDLDHDAVFAVIQALLEGDALPPAGLALRAITFDAFAVHGGQSPRGDAAHGVWGLLQSLSREHPAIRVSQLDLARAELDPALPAGLADAALGAAPVPAGQRELRALRGGRLYRRELFGVRTPDAAAERSLFRPGGVYVVVGGAGGVGMAFVRWLRARYGARVVVVGRRALDDGLRSRLQTAGRLDDEIVYAQAAVEDSAALRQVLESARARFGALHGVVHSAMVLDDRRLNEMDAASLARVLAPKVSGVRALAAATAGFDLDGLLFFSSIQSYLGNAAQANYAAASTYLDGYAASLRAERAYPVQVVNWGFWGEVGAVATPVYRQLLARQGVHGLEAAPAFALLEQATAAGWDDVLIASAEDEVLREMGASDAWLLERRPVSGARPPEATDSPLGGQRAKRAWGPAPAGTGAIVLAEAPMRQRAAALESTRAALDALVALAHGRAAQVLADLGLGSATAAAVDAAVASGHLAREHATLTKLLVQTLSNADAARPALLDTGAFDAGLAALELAKADADRPALLSAGAFDAGVAALEQGQPALRAFTPLLQAAVGAYPELLRGRKTAAEVLFPGGSSHLVRAVYGDSALSRHYNQVVADAVCALAQRGERDAPVRILEIGAGTGATTVDVLRALDAAGVPCHYHYTDLWDKLVADARERLGPVHPQLRFGFLDIGAPPEAQGHSASYDIVVATNVLHATRDLHLALRHAKRLLRPGGALIVNESVEAQPYSTLTFGLLPGWWGASDTHERLDGAPLASTSAWMRMLRDEGYVDVQPLVPDAACAGGQQVLLALSDGETRHPGAAATRARPAAPATPARQPGLPAQLQGRLQPFALPRGPADAEAGGPLRHLHLYRDEVDGHLWLFLDNAPANTFNEALLVELCAVLEALTAGDALRGRLLFVSHFGEYFSLGGDRGEIVRRLEAGERTRIEHFAAKASELLQRLVSLDALVVAVVAGTAQGGGMETLFATDLQLVGETVQLGLPEVKSGLLPGMGGMSWLQNQIGSARTKRLLLLGELIDAREAHALGLISHVVADPFAAALALPRSLSNLDTALRIKRVLARDAAQRHTADIETWLQHLLHAPINKRRIENAGLLLHAKMALGGARPPEAAERPLGGQQANESLGAHAPSETRARATPPAHLTLQVTA